MMVTENRNWIFKIAVYSIVFVALLVGFYVQGTTGAALGKSQYAKGIIQSTAYGNVQGSEVYGGRTLLWKGIPYAKAPTGVLRWKAPEKPDAWSMTFDATKDGNIGVQISGGKPCGSEDCLNLNIYRPNTDDTGLPVLVYIHGGNNQSGTSLEINPQQLVVNAKVVVVSLNYRLGLLGFNILPALRTGNAYEDSGNYALLDISRALAWIKENIGFFGGNNENITVSGFSAGGRDVMALLISPLFAGQFQKAISFSGGMTIADAEASTRLIAKAIAPLVVADNVKKTETEAYQWLLTTDKAVNDYLYKLDAYRLAGRMVNAKIRMSVFPHLYNDGTVLPKKGFKTEKYNAVPLIMVTGSQEFSLFARYDPEFVEIKNETLISNADVYQRFQFANHFGSKLYELFNTQESAEKMIDKYGAPIYTCNFKWGSNQAIVGEKMAKIFGSFHGIWMPFLTNETTGFSAVFSKAFKNTGAHDLQIKFTKYIANFLWTGDPNGEGLVEWKPWMDTRIGPAQLLLNADKEKAIIAMSESRTKYEDVLKEMEADTSIPKEAKDKLIQEVLNGRWFSGKLDEHFGNPEPWLMVD